MRSVTPRKCDKAERSVVRHRSFFFSRKDSILSQMCIQRDRSSLTRFPVNKSPDWSIFFLGNRWKRRSRARETINARKFALRDKDERERGPNKDREQSLWPRKWEQHSAFPRQIIIAPTLKAVCRIFLSKVKWAFFISLRSTTLSWGTRLHGSSIPSCLQTRQHVED